MYFNFSLTFNIVNLSGLLWVCVVAPDIFSHLVKARVSISIACIELVAEQWPSLGYCCTYSRDSHDDVSHAESAGHYFADLMTVDIQSDSFGSLPPEVQHELLLERQQVEKYSRHNPTTLPQVRNLR